MSEFYKNGETYVVRVAFKGKRYKIYTGMKNKRQVERLADRIDEIKTAKAVGVLSAELMGWIQTLKDSNSKIYSKLCEIGIVDPISESLTLHDLCTLFFKNRRDDMNTTTTCLRMAWVHLFNLLGPDKKVSDISVTDAIDFNERIKKGNFRVKKPYSDMTYHNIMTRVRGVMKFAVKIDAIRKSPFQDIDISVIYNRDHDFYYTTDLVSRMMGACEDPLLRTAIALGRYAGLRGISELHPITWDSVHWPKDGEYGYIHIVCPKTHREDPLPLLPVIEEQFKILKKMNYKGSMFQGITGSYLTIKVSELLCEIKAPSVSRPWYNLRKSYCCDLMEKVGGDPLLYESLARHSFTVGMKCYQILHPDRKIKGWDKLFE